MMLTKWPEQWAIPPLHLEFDWRSGLWEFADEATVRLGRGTFGGWYGAFLIPAPLRAYGL